MSQQNFPGDPNENQTAEVAIADPMVFDPTASFDFGPDAGANEFDDLVQGDTAKTIAQELASGSFAAVDISDFREFQTRDVIVDDGSFVFVVEQRPLRLASTLISQTAKAGSCNFRACKITLYNNKIRVATGHANAFCEVFIKTHEEVEGITEGSEPSFIFDHVILNRIASTFIDAVITFSLDAKRGLLRIHSGETHIELATVSAAEFPDYHQKLGEPEVIGAINPEKYREAIKYNSLFARKDDVNLSMSQIDIRNGLAISGSHAAIGVFSNEAIKALDVKIRYDVIGLMDKILATLNPEKTMVYSLGQHILFRDENLFFGIEIPKAPFPAAETILKEEREDTTLVQRSTILSSLYKLSVVNTDHDLQVRVLLENSMDSTRLTLETQDPAGRTSRDVLEARRQPSRTIKSTPAYQPVDCYANLSSMVKIFEHFKTPNVALEFVVKKGEPKAMVIIDEDSETGFSASSIVSLLSEAQVAARRAAKATEDSKAGKTKLKSAATDDADAE